jgi:hypothetical protein
MAASLAARSIAAEQFSTTIDLCPLLSESGQNLRRSEMTLSARSGHSASSFDHHFSAEQFRVGADDR